MFHLTCAGWLIFRSRSAGQIGNLGWALVTNMAPTSVDPSLLATLLLYLTPLVAVHACEALSDNVLAVRRLPTVVRYSVYAGTLYLTMLFGNFGGSDFIYFQF
jgi:hypothetical protein